MELNRWNDDRIDDLATLVRTNDKRLDTVEDKADEHGKDLNRMFATGDRRSNRNWQVWLVVLGQAGTIITLIATHH